MFTLGQWIFGAIFFISFVIAMIYSYGKDKNLHRQTYKGNYKILIGFFVFILFLLIIKYYFKH